MNSREKIEELESQIDTLAEILRSAATALLGITQEINNAYKQYVEYREATNIDEVAEEPTFSRPTIETCMHCNSMRNEDSDFCIVCGIVYDE